MAGTTAFVGSAVRILRAPSEHRSDVVCDGSFVQRRYGFRTASAATRRRPLIEISSVRMDVKFADEDTKLNVKSKDIFMPALSSTMTEGRIVQWLKKPGDKVSVGETIMVVESDKADMDVESFEEGYLAQVLTQEGGTAAVGATVALLAETEEDIQKVIDCGTECIVPGASHRHDGTTSVTLGTSDEKPVTHEGKPPETAQADAQAAPAAAAKPTGIAEIFMPALSSTMEEGKIVQWLKKEGDSIAVGESVMVVESDKADMDVEAFEGGVLAHIGLQDGSSARVGETVAYIAPSAAEVAAIKAWAQQQQSKSAPAPAATPAAAAASTPPSAPVASSPQPASAQVVNEGRIVASPYAKTIATEKGIDLKFVRGTGPDGRIVAKDVESAVAEMGASTRAGAAHSPSRVFATPAAKKIAQQENLSLDSITGTGNFGRITADDVLRAAGKAVEPTPSPTPAPKAPVKAAEAVEEKAAKPSRKSSSSGPPPEGAVPMTAIQKSIAKNMTATLTIPSYSVSYEIGTSALDELYKKLKGKGVTTSSLLAKAVALVLRKHPIMNARYQDPDTLVYKKDADIGVAVATPDGGLVTPVLRKCDSTDIYSVSRSWKELVRKALEKKLTGKDMSDTHFMISNLGMFGVSQFEAIVPVNSGAILAVSASMPKVVLQDNGLIGVEKVMTVTCTCDHRVIQGAQCADFLRDLADLLENNIDSVMY